MLDKKINIAIDGPSGSGKSTLAKRLASHYNLVYIDTGALYRAVGLHVRELGYESTDIKGIVSSLDSLDLTMKLEDGGGAVYLNGKKTGDELRTPTASIYASDVSKIPEVRAFLLETQRSIARENNCVMDGRDIGTVILPDADVKIFLHASDDDRAARRYDELTSRGENVILEDVKNDMRWRDENDRNRDIAPAVPASDSHILDNSGFECDDTFAAAKKIIEETVRF